MWEDHLFQKGFILLPPPPHIPSSIHPSPPPPRIHFFRSRFTQGTDIIIKLPRVSSAACSSCVDHVITRFDQSRTHCSLTGDQPQLLLRVQITTRATVRRFYGMDLNKTVFMSYRLFISIMTKMTNELKTSAVQ